MEPKEKPSQREKLIDQGFPLSPDGLSYTLNPKP